jgi:archaemetzincin
MGVFGSIMRDFSSETGGATARAIKVFLSLFLILGLVSSLFNGAAMNFTPPDQKERRRAIGSTAEESQILRVALEPGDDFQPLPEPGPHDWLANHHEPGQTFQAFVHAPRNKPDEVRNKIYLQPLDEFPAASSPSLDRLRQFAEAFFTLEVEVLPVMKLADGAIETRKNPYAGHQQLLTGDILALLARQLPDDAYCLLGITMHDLYPHPSWNFVFGQASYRERVGVYSFTRYDPCFYEPGATYDQELMLRRSCKVLAHETSHMFGIEHCIFFQCLMNGSNHLEESDARPLRLCPVDLRKLHQSLQFDALNRYRQLLDFYTEAGFDDEAGWLQARIERIEEQMSSSMNLPGKN